MRYLSSLQSPSLLAQLRRSTGFALNLCRQALQYCNNDIEKARKWLDESIKIQIKNQSSNVYHHMKPNNGLSCVTKLDSRLIAINLNAQSDFVSMNETFSKILDQTSHLIIDDFQNNTLNITNDQYNRNNNSKNVESNERFTYSEFGVKDLSNDIRTIINKASIQFKEDIELKVRLFNLHNLPKSSSNLTGVSWHLRHSIFSYTSVQNTQFTIDDGICIKGRAVAAIFYAYQHNDNDNQRQSYISNNQLKRLCRNLLLSKPKSLSSFLEQPCLFVDGNQVGSINHSFYDQKQSKPIIMAALRFSSSQDPLVLL